MSVVRGSVDMNGRADEPTHREDELGAIRWLYEVYFFALIIVVFGVVQRAYLPDIVGKVLPMGLVAGGVLLLVLTPSAALRRARIDLLVLGLITWLMMSGAWTSNVAEWRYAVIRIGLLGVVVMAMVGAAGIESFIRSMKAVTLFAVGAAFAGAVVSPGTTTRHLDDAGQFLFAGWRGTFDHKSGMMMFLCIGAATFLCFEPRPALRRLTLGGIVLITVLTQSATGAAVLPAVFFVNWALIRARAARQRQTPFPLYLTAFIVVALVLLVLSAPAIVNLYGKDLTFTGRTKIWTASLGAIEQQPVTGYGMGGVFFDKTSEPTASMVREIGFAAGNAHQGSLNLALELGLVGLGLYLALIVSTYLRIRSWRDRDPDLARWATVSLAAVVLFSLSEAVTFAGYWTVVIVLAVLEPRPHVLAGAPAPRTVWPSLSRRRPAPAGAR